MTPEEIQAAFAAQLEFNRQIAQQATEDRQFANERLTRLESVIEVDRQATLNEINIDFMRVTREAFARMDQTNARLDQTIAELRASNEELRAANQRQERINDFLLRERGLNGG
jgi:hypothetical protein